MCVRWFAQSEMISGSAISSLDVTPMRTGTCILHQQQQQCVESVVVVEGGGGGGRGENVTSNVQYSTV